MNPNESAFPLPGVYDREHTGLTVRAYIATKLAAGILANPKAHELVPDSSERGPAYMAVRCADALIAELSKTP